MTGSTPPPRKRSRKTLSRLSKADFEKYIREWSATPIPGQMTIDEVLEEEGEK